MEINAVLCNHAEAVDNKLYLNGGGINMCLVGPDPPHVVALGLGVIIHVPYPATNEQHRLLIVLLDEDGVPVVPFQPPGVPKGNPVRMEVPFSVGRPDFLPIGDDQTLALAANFPSLPLQQMGLFSFIFEVDGSELRRLPFRVMRPPQSQQGPAGN